MMQAIVFYPIPSYRAIFGPKLFIFIYLYFILESIALIAFHVEQDVNFT